jgi:hypothetical protein
VRHHPLVRRAAAIALGLVLASLPFVHSRSLGGHHHGAHATHDHHAHAADHGEERSTR